MSRTSNTPTVVTYEDRPDALAGVVLLARSLARHSPGTPFWIYSPHAQVARALSDLPTVRWIETTDLAGRGWNAKPAVLLRTLEHADQALWLDSDIVALGPLRPMLDRFSRGALIVATEYADPDDAGARVRSDGFGLDVRRSLGRSVNSGAVRATHRHRALLERWNALLGGSGYLAAQALPPAQREIAFVGDQDALWAAIASAETETLDVAFFELGRDMVMHVGGGGFSVADRLSVLAGSRPAFVHMLGRNKPWSFGASDGARGASAYLAQVCYELSPYFEEARAYRRALGEPAWLSRRTLAARAMNALALGNVSLRGLPLAALAEATRGLRHGTVTPRPRPRGWPGYFPRISRAFRPTRP